jgi:hypothetical protein
MLLIPRIHELPVCSISTPNIEHHVIESKDLVKRGLDLLRSVLSSDPGRVPAQADDLVAEHLQQTRDLTGKLQRLSSFPSAQGGYADIWICNYPGDRGRENLKVMNLSL